MGTMTDKTKEFLSIQAQDFIEESAKTASVVVDNVFLSIQAQDFIEDKAVGTAPRPRPPAFLSIQAQDFIEEEIDFGI